MAVLNSSSQNAQKCNIWLLGAPVPQSQHTIVYKAVKPASQCGNLCS